LDEVAARAACAFEPPAAFARPDVAADLLVPVPGLLAPAAGRFDARPLSFAF
jgi:hypothetical protein